VAARERWVRAPRAACANGRATTPVNRRFHRGTKKIHAPNKSLEAGYLALARAIAANRYEHGYERRGG
jgi:hypothetical protein